jgi:hypothetical protein
MVPCSVASTDWVQDTDKAMTLVVTLDVVLSLVLVLELVQVLAVA